MKFKRFIPLYLMSMLLLTFNSAFSNPGVPKSCKPSIQGPPGPTGATGPRGLRGFQGPTGEQGPPFFNAFASGSSVNPQTLNNSISSTVIFETNVYTPQGITHIIGISPDTFTVLTAGTYLINWSLVLQAFSNTNPQDVGIGAQVELTSTTNPLLLAPYVSAGEFSQFVTLDADTGGFITTLAGHLSISLPANTAIQLTITPFSLTPFQGTLGFRLRKRLFSITRIGDFVP